MKKMYGVGYMRIEHSNMTDCDMNLVIGHVIHM